MLNEVYLVRMHSFLLHFYLHIVYIRLSTILLLSLKYRIDVKYTVLFVVSKYCHTCENFPRGSTQHKHLKGIKELHLARRGVNRARSNVLLKANLCSSKLGLKNEDRKSIVHAVSARARSFNSGRALRNFTEMFWNRHEQNRARPVMITILISLEIPQAQGCVNRCGTKSEKGRQSGSDGGVYIGRRRTLVR